MLLLRIAEEKLRPPWEVGLKKKLNSARLILRQQDVAQPQDHGQYRSYGIPYEVCFVSTWTRAAGTRWLHAMPFKVQFHTGRNVTSYWSTLKCGEDTHFTMKKM